MAAPPSPNSSPSCNPAVPPPPVAGAPAGILAACVACVVCVVRDGCLAGLDADVLECPVGLFVGLADAAAEWLALASGVELPEWLDPADAEEFALALVCTPVDMPVDGVKIAGCVEPELVHPHTVAETRTVRIAQLTALSRTLEAVPGGIMRTFMTPPYIPWRRSYRHAMACFPFEH
jgi:hypothetical protein